MAGMLMKIPPQFIRAIEIFYAAKVSASPQNDLLREIKQLVRVSLSLSLDLSVSLCLCLSFSLSPLTSLSLDLSVSSLCPSMMQHSSIVRVY
jgi:hypothetical protein